MAISLPAGMSVNATVGEEFIVNGDFSAGLEGWTYVYSGKTGEGRLDIVSDPVMGPDVLEYERWLSYNDGGAVWAYQPLDIDVDDYSEIWLEADIKVISNTLPDSGWWSYVYGGIGELPCHILIRYIDVNGKSWIWSHGFLPNPDYWGRQNVTVVTKGQWYHYTSGNLVEMKTSKTEPGNVPIDSPPAKKITGIYVGGNGWDFKGRIDNVSLRGIPKVIPATIDIDPDTLNLKSKGKWITARIELPEGYDVAEIDGATVMLEGAIAAHMGKEGWAKPEANESNIMDEDGDGELERMVKFDRAAVIDFLKLVPHSQVTLTVTGEVAGLTFEGTDTIRVK
jgi:hypothetical protein